MTNTSVEISMRGCTVRYDTGCHCQSATDGNISTLRLYILISVLARNIRNKYRNEAGTSRDRERNCTVSDRGVDACGCRRSHAMRERPLIFRPDSDRRSTVQCVIAISPMSPGSRHCRTENFHRTDLDFQSGAQH